MAYDVGAFEYIVVAASDPVVERKTYTAYVVHQGDRVRCIDENSAFFDAEGLCLGSAAGKHLVQLDLYPTRESTAFDPLQLQLLTI